MRLYRRKKGGAWWVDIREEGARERFSLATTDRRVAEARAAQYLAESRRQQVAEALGVETHREAREAPLVDLLDEYGRDLDRRGVTPKWRAVTLQRCGILLTDMGARSLADVTPERVADALAALTVAGPPKAQHRRRRASAKSQNHYRSALSSFFRWLMRQGRWPSDPCAVVRRARVVEEAPRRPLRPDELTQLLETTKPWRALCYLVAATTGLRRRELDTLTWSDVNFEDGTVTVRASNEKARRGAVIPLAPIAAELWNAYRADPWSFARGRGHSKRIWRERLDRGLALPPIPTPTTLRSDLAAAGLAGLGGEGAIDLHGLRVDFHGLRVTFVTNLARAGVGLAQAQKLARHSDPRLTAKVYTRLDQADGRDAMEALGGLLDGARVGVPPCAPSCASNDGAESKTNDLRLNARKSSDRSLGRAESA